MGLQEGLDPETIGLRYGLAYGNGNSSAPVCGSRTEAGVGDRQVVDSMNAEKPPNPGIQPRYTAGNRCMLTIELGSIV